VYFDGPFLSIVDIWGRCKVDTRDCQTNWIAYKWAENDSSDSSDEGRECMQN
jgi:hypothetical protein